jgi:putative RecB family exonuclease
MRIDKLRENPHWSYSAMQCYLTCPLKYKFRYIDNAEPERTGSCFIFGKAFHAALSERARIGKDMSEREVCDVFEDYFKVECKATPNLTFKPKEDYDSMLQTGFRMNWTR